LQGTRAALSEAGRESLTITMDVVDARTVGALIALYERAVGLYAELADINAYHQPGVEAGKKAAKQVLDLQARVRAALRDGGQRSLSAEELAKELAVTDVEAVYLVLRHLAANPHQGVVRALEGEASPAAARFSLRRS
jgi:glucose-6-phosphate isomerase